MRTDIEKIIGQTLKKANRLVVSTSGYLIDCITKTAERFGNQIGLRISIEGLPAANDELRGLKDGFDRGLRTLVNLYDMGL